MDAEDLLNEVERMMGQVAAQDGAYPMAAVRAGLGELGEADAVRVLSAMHDYLTENHEVDPTQEP